MKAIRYLILISGLIVVFIALPAHAQSFPAFPMSFWGNVTLNGGPAPKGTIIKAYYNDMLAGEIAVQETGVYGYEGSVQQKLVVAEGSGSITFKFQSPLFNNNVETAGTSPSSHSAFTSGQAVNKDISFTAGGTSGTVDPTQLSSLITDGTFAPSPGSNPNDAPKIFVIRPVIISVATTGGNSNVNLPTGLQITRSDGSNIDSSALTASKPNPGSLTGLGNGIVLKGSLQWGIPNQGLQFSVPINLSIYVGADLNGQTLDVRRSVSGSGGWTSDGIVAPANCVVSSGICSFLATKASYFATTSTETQSSSSQSSSSGSGGGGGGGSTSTDSPPINATISINSGAASTSSVNVILILNVSAASQMIVWNDGEFDNVTWETYVPQKNWILNTGDGAKTVFVQYRSSSGLVSAIASDTITLSSSSGTVDEDGQVLGATTGHGAHPNGTLILDGQTIFLIKDGQRWGFRTPEEYFSHGYAFAQAVPANSADNALAEGSVIKALEGALVLDKTDGRTVYMIGLNGTKRGFTSAEVFKGLGYSFNRLLTIDLSDYTAGTPIMSGTEAHPEGALILDGKTVWWVKDGKRQGFESEAVFKTYGFTFGRVVASNATDMALPEGALVKFRDGTLVNDGGAVYIISDGKKLGFRNMDALTSRGYKIKNAITAKLDNYEDGVAME